MQHLILMFGLVGVTGTGTTSQPLAASPPGKTVASTGDDSATELGTIGPGGERSSNFPKLRPSRIAKMRAQASLFAGERDSHGNDLSELSGQTAIL